ncbi:MAG: hypothetical protein FD124_3817, partial [Alphaproteobacteria bacterium]
TWVLGDPDAPKMATASTGVEDPFADGAPAPEAAPAAAEPAKSAPKAHKKSP